MEFATGSFSFASGATVVGGTFSAVSGTVSFPVSGTTLDVALVDVAGGTAVFGGGYSATATTISAGTADYNANVTIPALTLSGGTLGGSGNVTLTGTVTWEDEGTIAAANTSIASGATLDFTAFSAELTGSLTNDGTFDTFGQVALEGSGTFTNSGLMSAESITENTIFGEITFVPYVEFSGPFDNTSTGVAQVAAQGTLILGGGGTGAGNFNVATGATVQFANTNYNLDSGATFTGTGTVEVASGSVSIVGSNVSSEVSQFEVVGSADLNVETNTTLANLYLLSSGTVNESANLTLTGTSYWEGGQFTGNYTTTVANGAVVNVTSVVPLRTTLSNDGTIILTANGRLTLVGPFTNQADGLVEWNGGQLNDLSYAIQTFTNKGTVTVAGTSTDSTVPIVNDGTFTIQSGTLNDTGATTTPATPAFANAGNLTIDAPATLSIIASNFEAEGGVTDVLGTLSSSATVDISSGTIEGTGTIAASLANAGIVAPGDPDGVLTVTGNYEQSGAIDVTATGVTPGSDYGQLYVEGTVTLNGGGAQLTPNYPSQPTDSYLILTQKTTTAIQGTFSGVPQGGLLVDGKNIYSVSYTAGSTGNDILLTSATFNQIGEGSSPAVTINNVSLPQASSGTVDYVFTVTLAEPQSVPVTVDYTTQNLTATAGVDYLASQGTLTFAPGQTTQTITVHVLGNPNPEASMNFAVDLSDPQLPATVEAVGIGTIVGTLSFGPREHGDRLLAGYAGKRL